MEADGLLHFDGARIGGAFVAFGVKFLGKPAEPHGFSAVGTRLEGGLAWQNVELRNGATLDLHNASANMLLDDESSWPKPGNLVIEGFTYNDFDRSPSDAGSRLRWIGLESGPHPAWLTSSSRGFRPQPYEQLAKVLRARGDEEGATTVLIALEDARYASAGLIGRATGAFLKWTIGYGHRPLLTIMWSLAIVLVGWAMVSVGMRADVMRATWPENNPSDRDKTYERLSPILYSLDLFLPFVNLHQEHYWWPDADARGECVIFGRSIQCDGAVLRRYFWIQIVAGWLLSAIFVAGVTGLIRGS
jgi:hypothetical protein